MTMPEDIDGQLIALQLSCIRGMVADLKYSPDQPRDDHGRFGSGGSESASPLEGAAAANAILAHADDIHPTAEQSEALNAYTSYSYGPMNNGLRRGSYGDPNSEQRVEQLKSLIESAPPVGQSVNLYRGLRDTDAFESAGVQDMKDLVGKTMADPGFMSTTTDSKIASTFAKSDGVLMTITTQPGDRILPASALVGSYEDEMVMSPGTAYRVTGVSVRSGGGYLVQAVTVRAPAVR